jgi:subtilisin family serine protease
MMMIKRLLKYLGPAIWLIFTTLSFTHDSTVAIAQQGIDKLDRSLVNQLTVQGRADYIVHFSAQADLSAAYSMDWDARGEFVYDTLLETARVSQKKAKDILIGNGRKYQTYIAGNELYIWNGDLTLAEQLAGLTEVFFIRATKTYHIDPIVVDTSFKDVTWAGDLLANNLQAIVGNTAAAITDWGIIDTHADQFWATFEVQGDGIVVANIDTGVQWNHPALDQAFKCGANPSDPSCWFDPSNICGGSACDNNGHGTHTMGTMVADDDPTLSIIAGMAPNAQWIACKGCEDTQCSDIAINSCADWILAPNGDPSNRPNVVNNSWGGSGGDPWFLSKVEAWRAAGIFPAFSAGNDGDLGCNTLGSPGDYQESFGSAAHDSGRNIASFSSRGPSVMFGDDPYTKPNLSAPGVGIISSYPTNGWASISGTSMASPHTAGAVALLMSCNPSLVGQIEPTFQVMQNSAGAPPPGSCGAPADGQGNNTYGYGYLDVFNAGLMTCSNIFTGTLEGHVYDDVANPIAGAAITAMPGDGSRQYQTITDQAGAYTMTLLTGSYDVTASKDYYLSKTITDVVIITNTLTTQDFSLAFLGGWKLLPLPTGCPDWYSYDGEYFPWTGKVYF